MAEEDRRTRRSRRMLKQGLAELMTEKKFQDITVRDIAERADLNRSTFYLHYTDTYDLLQKLEADALEEVQEMIDAHRADADAGMLSAVFEPILEYIVENRGICFALFVNNSTSNFVDKVYRLIYENGTALIRKRFSDVPSERQEYLLCFLTYGLIGLIKHWFDTDMNLDKKEVVRMADQLANAAATAILISPALQN